jgi:3'-5' exoribonuclease
MPSPSKFLQPNLVDAFNSFFLEGCYVLVGFVTKIDSNDNPFWLITIADATGILTLYSNNKDNIYSKLQPQVLVQVEAKVMISGSQSFYQCDYIRPLKPEENQFTSLRQLPKSLCAKPEELDLLIKLVESIPHACLSRFVLDVLSKPEIGIAYILNPASIGHHHSYGGGLLEHSVQVAQSFHDDTQISAEDKSLGIVASLLHDVGKTLVYTSNINYTALGYLVNHDSLTLEICSEALTTLAKTNVGYANVLRHAWTCSTPKSRYGFKPKTAIARKLQDYDLMSARLCMQPRVLVSNSPITKEIAIGDRSVA